MTAGGDAAAKAAGTTFEDMIEQQLFGPAGMTRSSARYADLLAEPDRSANSTGHLVRRWSPRTPSRPVVDDDGPPHGGLPAGPRRLRCRDVGVTD